MSQHIIIIGAGFAALRAARRLREQGPELKITLVGPKPEFIYLPSLIWIPAGLRHPDDLRIPLGTFLRRHHIDFFAAEVVGLKAGGRVVETNKGELENDGLIIASGGRFLKRLPGVEHVITPCEGIPAALEIKQRLESMEGGTIAIGFGGNPKEPSAMRGGPMFEFLFGIDTLLRQQGRRDRFRLVFFNPAAQPGQRLGPRAVKGLLAVMKKRAIETHLGHKLLGFEHNKVLTEGGEIEADLMLFMPGMTGNHWFDRSELPRSEGGLVSANAMCQVIGMPQVYVAGDSGSFPGPDWMPKQAHMADLQALTAADNLLAEMRGAPPTHTFKVELICIVDSLDQGMLVLRTPTRSLVLPALRLLHWAKRLHEWWYLRQYR